MMTQGKLQALADGICRAYKVPSIKIKVTDRILRSGASAVYTTQRLKIGGRIQPRNIPVSITVFEWGMIKKYPGEIAHRLGHELAHHVRNVKANSLAHNSAFYKLEDDICLRLSRKLK